MSRVERTRESGEAADSLASYLREIRKYPLLTRDEEAELARRSRTGDAEALQRLVCSNLRFVVSIAKRYQHHGVALADLIDEGNLGLMRAAQRFDETKGAKLISYAVWWIRQAIVQALADHGHTVRIPLNQAGIVYRFGRHANALSHGLGREPSADEVADDLELSAADLARTIPISRAYLSLDAPVGANDGGNLLDYIPDDVAAPPDDDATIGNVADSVDRALTELPKREAAVLRSYFGFDSEPMTLEAIGEQMGITRERVRQIKEKALWRIRNSKRVKALASLRGR